MTRKETALDALNKKIPRLEEKIREDTKLLDELKAKKETLEFETFKQYLKDNGITTGSYRQADGFLPCGSRTKDNYGGQKKCGTLKKLLQHFFQQ